MKASEQSRFDHLYQRHLRALKLQGLSDKTIEPVRYAGWHTTMIAVPIN